MRGSKQALSSLHPAKDLVQTLLGWTTSRHFVSNPSSLSSDTRILRMKNAISKFKTRAPFAPNDRRLRDRRRLNDYDSQTGRDLHGGPETLLRRPKPGLRDREMSFSIRNVQFFPEVAISSTYAPKMHVGIF